MDYPQRISPRARIGMVNFINTAPFYEVWKKTVKRPEWRITEGPPRLLNELLFRDELDFGLISSHEFALHAGAYELLADLSISAVGPVGSVFLFSELAIRDLDGQPVALSPQSQTSNSLVKIILEDFLGVRPRFLHDADEKATPARLAIGDEALRLANEKRYPLQLDLGEAWQKQTGLPFVFAVWAVRRTFAAEAPSIVNKVRGELKRCVREGRKELAAISAAVAPRIPMPVKACESYLQGMEYDLGPTKLEALTFFFSQLIRRGEVEPTALPLKIFGQ